MTTRRSLVTALSAVGLAGCASRPDAGEADSTPAPPDPGTYWYTRPQPTGNRTLSASGDVRGADPVTFAVDGRPQWLVAHPAESGSRWTVVADDGRASQWLVADGEATMEAEYDPLPAGTPPVVATGDGGSRLLAPPEGMAERSSPVVAPGGDGEGPTLLYLADDGDLVVVGETTTRLAVDGLPDGRIVAVGDGRYALFGDATDRYTHGALGDVTEGSRLVVVDPHEPAVVASASVGPPEVFEGLGPLAADLDGDGDPELVTTLADATNGARIAVFDAGARRVATGPVHEPGWRHQLTVAPLGPGGDPELAVVRKPHVDKLLELYRLDGGSLPIVATVDGVSTHTYGSRVTDGALAADLDDDGATELWIPTSTRTEMAAVRHGEAGADVAWRTPLDGAVVTNLTGIGIDDGVAVGAGVGGEVRVWEG